MYHLIQGTVGTINYNSEEVTNCETNSGNDTFESGIVQTSYDQVEENWSA